MPDVLLSCGCRANSIDGKGNPSCVIHAGLVFNIHVIETPNLRERKARCIYCKNITNSSISLPFFVYKGENSPEALERCKCGYFKSAHENGGFYKDRDGIKGRKIPGICDNFISHGAYEFDEYYDGCRGWD